MIIFKEWYYLILFSSDKHLIQLIHVDTNKSSKFFLDDVLDCICKLTILSFFDNYCEFFTPIEAQFNCLEPVWNFAININIFFE